MTCQTLNQLRKPKHDHINRIRPRMPVTTLRWPHGTGDDEQMHFAIRGICGRMLRLTSVLMDCMGESGPASDEALKIIRFAKTGGAA
jgi:hypothetical protein